MSNITEFGPRKIPEEELKFGFSLRAELFFAPNEPVNVVVFGVEDLKNDQLLEAVSSTYQDSSLRRVGKTLLAVNVNTPDIRSQLINIAANEEVHSIDID